jgi:hypothetical protein
VIEVTSLCILDESGHALQSRTTYMSGGVKFHDVDMAMRVLHTYVYIVIRFVCGSRSHLNGCMAHVCAATQHQWQDLEPQRARTSERCEPAWPPSRKRSNWRMYGTFCVSVSSPSRLKDTRGRSLPEIWELHIVISSFASVSMLPLRSCISRHMFSLCASSVPTVRKHTLQGITVGRPDYAWNDGIVGAEAHILALI